MCDTKFGRIRSAFNTELLEIGCCSYSLYIEDKNLQNRYVPFDIDPCLGFPERAYNSPRTDRLERLIKTLDLHTPAPVIEGDLIDIRSRFFSDASSTRFGHARDYNAFSAHKHYLQHFVHREGIRSLAVLSPKLSVMGNQLSEILFINFHKYLEFDDEIKIKINKLAAAILSFARKCEQQSVPTTQITSVDNMVLPVVLDNMSDPRSLTGDSVNGILLQIRRAISITEEIPIDDLLCSLHQLRQDPEALELVTLGVSATGSSRELDRKVNVKGGAMPITLLATITGCPHLVCDTGVGSDCTFWMSNYEYMMLAETFNEFHEPTIYTYENFAMASLSREDMAIVTEVCGRSAELAPLLERIGKRASQQYRSLFSVLHSEFSDSRSELCIPLVYDEQCLGCINVECKQHTIWSPDIVDAMSRVAMTTAFAFRLRNHLRLLDGVSAAATAIQVAPVGADAKPLDELAQAVQEVMQVSQIDFVIGTDRASNIMKFDRVASSATAWRMRPTTGEPRDTGGWTSYLATKTSRDVIGLVLLVSDLGENRNVQSCYLMVYANHGDDSGGRQVVLREHEPDDEIELNISDTESECVALVAVKMKSREDVSSHYPVMWCSIDRYKSQLVGLTPASLASEARRQLSHQPQAMMAKKFLEELIMVSRLCSIGPLTWFSHLQTFQQFYHDLHHGGFDQVMTTCVNWIDDAEDMLCSINDNENGLAHKYAVNKLRDASVIGTYLQYKSSLIQDLRFYSSVDQARKSFRAQSTSINERIHNSFNAARLMKPCDNWHFQQIGMDVVYYVHADVRALCVLFTETFMNSLIHGEQGEAGLQQIICSARLIEKDLLELKIANSGPEFAESQLSEWSGTSTESGVGVRHETGDNRHRGAPIILHLGEALGVMPVVAINESHRLEDGQETDPWPTWIFYFQTESVE
ncbi:MAG: hypothetical protein H6813_06755 [Phycisphaeraceae bacterium]|nr:hypothetical protein [Phycisphaeraceae bacterium]